jgi:gluconokinase
MVDAALHVVVMGVAGCGKSAVGARLAARLGLPLIEGDDFHPPANVAKMQRGEPLTDADRAGWLATLGQQLGQSPGGAVLTCSALKRRYRNGLRVAWPGLRFIYLQISPEESLRRVAMRSAHFYPSSLVASQFEALQSPEKEALVLTLDATAGLEELAWQATQWLRLPGL